MKQLEVQELAEALESQNVQELKEHINNILHVLAAQEAIGVMEDDKVIAQVAPMNEPSPAKQQSIKAFLDDMNQLAIEIGAHWKGDMSAVDAVRDVRRDL